VQGHGQGALRLEVAPLVGVGLRLEVAPLVGVGLRLHAGEAPPDPHLGVSLLGGDREPCVGRHLQLLHVVVHLVHGAGQVAPRHSCGQRWDVRDWVLLGPSTYGSTCDEHVCVCQCLLICKVSKKKMNWHLCEWPLGFRH